VFPPTSMYC